MANKVQPGRREGRNIVPGVMMVGELGELMKSLGDEFDLEVGIKTFPNLQHAMDVAIMGDSVLVCSDVEHKVKRRSGEGGAYWAELKGGKWWFPTMPSLV